MRGEKNEKSQKDLFERCVCCGAKTEIRRDMDIDRRRTYIEGAGQLCNSCFFKLYGR